ncbi:DUF2752 domain-containing protein [Stigmatella aurantiaca]|uniref:Conserved uncharacterized protein n=1 Tax=Stigmatella aurantiaca (strain DW4/3-1) TaxID=378806 RepID=Q09CQ5_STIAD|nr:DUF2752 domain-containing protein [Stigmatella aurantiaca]ADO70063.1 conserved uncharacterized protein [Stigmatella aurantiaca DW4/3-1]EAU69526.1 conserved hypothetical protein [Stigmatella aurantiaca DW4/3-1]
MKVFFPPPNRRLGPVDVLGLVGLTGLLIGRYVPVAKLIPFWGCILRETTGWPCLGCGLTRVADRVAHFNFIGAWEANPMGTVAALLFALAAVVMLLHMAFKMPVPEVQLSPREWTWVRVAFPILLFINYAYVVVKTKFPHLLT